MKQLLSCSLTAEQKTNTADMLAIVVTCCSRCQPHVRHSLGLARPRPRSRPKLIAYSLAYLLLRAETCS